MSCSFLKCYKLSSPIGELILETCEHGISKLSQSALDDTTFIPKSSTRIALISREVDNIVDSHAMDCIEWLQMYFSHGGSSFSHIKPDHLPNLCLSQSKFREDTLVTLAEKVGFGETISYGKLAELVGKKGASQAVGTAMAQNPIALIIPCHRVVRNDGRIGNYSSGRKNKIKVWLLEHEGIEINERGFLAKKI